MRDPYPLLLPSGGAFAAPNIAARRKYKQLQLAARGDAGIASVVDESTPGPSIQAWLKVPDGFWRTAPSKGQQAFEAAKSICEQCGAHPVVP